MNLGKSAQRSGTRRNVLAGFSIIELLVSILVMLVLTVIAIPSLMRSLHAYQLNSAAGRVSDMLKYARFEAVRRNKQLNFLAQASGPNWVVGTDSNNSGALDATEKQETIAGYVALLPAGAPVPTGNAISAALGGAALTTMSGANGSITFDARGAIRQAIGGAISNNVDVFYVGNAVDTDPGYRAVVLLPSGSVQIWTSPNGGPWRQVQ